MRALKLVWWLIVGFIWTVARKLGLVDRQNPQLQSAGNSANDQQITTAPEV